MKTSGGNRSDIPVAAGATPTHAAITRNLYTWSSYKNWAERVKTDWDGGEEK